MSSSECESSMHADYTGDAHTPGSSESERCSLNDSALPFNVQPFQALTPPRQRRASADAGKAPAISASAAVGKAPALKRTSDAAGKAPAIERTYAAAGKVLSGDASASASKVTPAAAGKAPAANRASAAAGKALSGEDSGTASKVARISESALSDRGRSRTRRTRTGRSGFIRKTDTAPSSSHHRSPDGAPYVQLPVLASSSPHRSPDSPPSLRNLAFEAFIKNAASQGYASRCPSWTSVFAPNPIAASASTASRCSHAPSLPASPVGDHSLDHSSDPETDRSPSPVRGRPRARAKGPKQKSLPRAVRIRGFITSPTTTCPICPGQRPYTRLSKHMRDIHHMQTDQRRNRASTSEKGQRCIRRVCPICEYRYFRLRDHLERQHNVPRGDRLDRFMHNAETAESVASNCSVVLPSSPLSGTAYIDSPGSPPSHPPPISQWLASPLPSARHPASSWYRTPLPSSQPSTRPRPRHPTIAALSSRLSALRNSASPAPSAPTAAATAPSMSASSALRTRHPASSAPSAPNASATALSISASSALRTRHPASSAPSAPTAAATAPSMSASSALRTRHPASPAPAAPTAAATAPSMPAFSPPPVVGPCHPTAPSMPAFSPPPLVGPCHLTAPSMSASSATPTDRHATIVAFSAWHSALRNWHQASPAPSAPTAAATAPSMSASSPPPVVGPCHLTAPSMPASSPPPVVGPCHLTAPSMSASSPPPVVGPCHLTAPSMSASLPAAPPCIPGSPAASLVGGRGRKPLSYLHCPVLKRFYRWQGPELGTNLVSAAQRCAHIFQIWCAVARDTNDMRQETPNFIELLDEDRVRDEWLVKVKENAEVTASTMIVYTYSLDTFVDFLRQQRFRLPPDALNRLQAATKRWRRPLGVKKRQRHAQLKAVLDSQIIKPDTFTRSFCHPFLTHLENRLCDYSGLEEGEQLHILFRYSQNYLLLRIASMNGQRNGAMRHMTVAEVERVRKEARGVTISVARHKRSEAGPARISLLDKYYSQLVGFLRIRKEMIGAEAASDKAMTVFLSMRKGVPAQMGSEEIDKSVKSIWRKAGNIKPISLTLIRKSVTTGVRHAYPKDVGVRDALAAHMCHGVRTADVHYDATQSVDVSFPIMEKIVASMGMDASRPSPAISASSVPSSHLESLALTVSASSVPSSALEPLAITLAPAMATLVEISSSGAGTPTYPLLDSPILDAAEAAASESYSAPGADSGRPGAKHVGVKVSPHKRRFFTADESRKVLELTDPLIQLGLGGSSITQQQAFDMLRNSAEGSKLLQALSIRAFDQAKDVKKVIIDKVRGHIRHVQRGFFTK